MKRSFLAAPFILFLFFSLSVSAVSLNGVSIPSASALKSGAPIQSVLPLPVQSPNSLLGIAVAQKTAESVFEREKESYAKIQAKSVDAPSAEKSLIQAQLSEQRYRFLVSILNRIIVIYQRVDYINANLDESLLRLRVAYQTRKSSNGIPDFDSRMQNLEDRLTVLHVQSKQVEGSLDRVKDSVDMSAALRSARTDVSALLYSLRAFLREYRVLVQDVMRP